ncbi:TetR family transcriptional regulator [Nitratireductor aestuarii]|uniref:TetR family transcriptional regulator n=1 Tax=Nitratireductor aestuarii TaxID=1735103 RepID=A0A916RR88_9HYPH|nr:TetR/AcrR family transcriptional regulator [Nitratireductor aestuarii]GGA66548.1 TetR family transcriptional regulator [Nitratireductor aestuarii]
METSETTAISDLWEMLQQGPRRTLAQAAVDEFGKRGFHATTTRHIAERIGMSPAALYIHYPSKADLLFTIAKIGHEAVLNESLAAVEGISDHHERVLSFVRTFTAWHAVNHLLARVIQYELHSLQPDHLKEIAAIRRRTADFAAEEFRHLVSDTSKLRMRTVACLSLSIDVARWYVPGKSPAPEELGAEYAQLVIAMLRS